MIESTEIKISEIRTDGGTQPRAQLNWITVNEYAESIIDGATLPPVEVVYDGKDYWLWDGFHRVEAHKKAECISVRAHVKQGTRRDAVLLSFGANEEHGLRRTNEDKRRSVEAMLADPEWSDWPDKDIASACKVSREYVVRTRAKLSSDRSLDRSVVVHRNGTTYTQNTANIGKAPTPPVGTVKLTPPPATTVLVPKPALAPAVPAASKPAGEVVRSETRFTMAPPIRDDEFDDDDIEEDADGCDAEIINDMFGSEETSTSSDEIASKPNATEKVSDAKSSGMAVHFSSESPEHYTPKEIIDAAIAVMGSIDLDPCSNSKTAPNVPALDHYTVDDDGLSMPWFGRVYLNPPYGRVIGGWTEKLAAEYEAGNVTEAIALVPGRIDTQWWQALGKDYHACFVTGRLTFIGNDDPAPFPSTVFYLGENVAKFFEVFSDIGQIWKRIDEHWFTS